MKKKFKKFRAIRTKINKKKKIKIYAVEIKM